MAAAGAGCVPAGTAAPAAAAGATPAPATPVTATTANAATRMKDTITPIDLSSLTSRRGECGKASGRGGVDPVTFQTRACQARSTQGRSLSPSSKPQQSLQTA